MSIIGVPLRSFSSSKGRLAPVLNEAERSGLAIRLARSTLDIATMAGAPLVATSAADVARWCASRDIPVVGDDGSLNGAARTIVASAGSRRWMVLHADLPILTVDDLTTAWELLDTHPWVLAPSHDGGTTLIAGRSPWTGFAYGPGSFHRHLAALPSAGILVRRGLALDVDTPAHLRWMHAITTARSA